MSKVLLIFTGGTISMRIDPKKGAVPALYGADILKEARGIEKLAKFEIVDYARQPGPSWTPRQMWELHEYIKGRLNEGSLTGVVVAHGTDTLEETAYLLDLAHSSPLPVVFTGAMRNSSELGWDGAANLYAAVRTVLHPEAWGQGVLVVLNDSIHAAADVTKTDTQALDSFQSPLLGPLGIVDRDVIFWNRSAERGPAFDVKKPKWRVQLLACYTGMSPGLVAHATPPGTRGLILVGTGRGNVPPEILPALDKVLGRGIAVVIASRCHHGRVLGTYGYAGGGADLRRRGVIASGFLPAHKARLKLMLALAAASNSTQLRALMESEPSLPDKK